jgi:CRP-like cAMP-binding protein
MLRRTVAAGEVIDPGDHLALLASGAVSLASAGLTIDELAPGAVFNEERAMFGLTPHWQSRAEADCEICLLPAEAIRQVPLLRWTLLEILDRRRAAALLPVFRQIKARRSAG